MVSQGSRILVCGIWDVGVRMWDAGDGILGMGYGMDYGVSSS